MKRYVKCLIRLLLVSAGVFFLILFSNSDVYAAAKTMPDGTVFDADFYASMYPEVAQIYGKSEADLYRHYIQFGKTEGRLAVPPASNTLSPLPQVPQVLPQSGERCVIIIGDSRTCSLNCTLYAIAPEKCYQFTEERKKSINNAVFKYDNVWYVITGEGGGCLSKGSYDNALNRCSKIIEGMPSLMACGSYSVVNLYAINDLYYNKTKYNTYPSTYLIKDAKLLTDYKYCSKVYQFNAGPVDPNGKAYKSGVTNDLIGKYNLGFVTNNQVTCVDLYTYLINSGYTAIVDKSDNSGLHYDPVTNVKIFNLIQAVVR